MKAAPYEVLAAALDRLPNGFPRTKGAAEILILKKILTPEEASLASLLTGTFEPTAAIAGRIGVSEAEARSCTDPSTCKECSTLDTLLRSI